MLLEMTTYQIHVPDAPMISGLAFRRFRDESDYTHIVDLINACSAADGVENHVTLEWALNYFTHVGEFDARRAVRQFTTFEKPLD